MLQPFPDPRRGYTSVLGQAKHVEDIINPRTFRISSSRHTGTESTGCKVGLGGTSFCTTLVGET